MIDDVTRDRWDVMVCAMARAVPSRGVCVGGLSTPLATVALVLAAETRSSDVWILATDGGQACLADRRLITVTGTSRAAADASIRSVPFPELILSLVPRHQPFELMRPAQLDRRGRSNNVLVNSSKGPLRLPGCGGIGDATSVNRNLHYYLPRHTRRTLVAEVDFASGGARPRAVGSLPRAPAGVITELCEMRFDPEGPTVTSVHPGVGSGELMERTGFPLAVPEETAITAGVSALEAAALGRIDPLRIRDLEFLAGEDRRRHLEAIVRAEEVGSEA